MLNLFPARINDPVRMSRGQWLRMTALAGAGWRSILGAVPSATASTAKHPRAQACISIFLCGGPSQPDLWDLKPLAPAGVRSEFAPIATSVPGTYFSELIPNVARHADKLALIRSMTHTDNDHGNAIAHSVLGQKPAIPGDQYIARHDPPGLGAIVQRYLGERGPLPAWIILPRYFGTNSPPYKGQSGGFLGTACDPVVFDKERKGSLTDARLTLGELEPAAGVDDQRLFARRKLAEALGKPLNARSVAAAEEQFDTAHGLLGTVSVRQAFQLDREPDSVRNRYGRNEYGQSLLMARRLVESGVRYVNVFWTFFDAKGCQFNLWDNHGVRDDVCGIDGQLTGRQQLTHQYCTPSFDRSFSALLEDLSQRGLLDDTLVTVAGEFGRTPKINATGGRDHWAHCYTQLLAGGGVKGGAVWGASDSQGAYLARDPVSPDDFAATALHAFGLDPELTVPDHLGRPLPISTGRPVTALF
ncbi:MAG: DUF1501 domain-containing protein [Planctomycetaceae bacterium]|nr:DUF1501 domain-containing protein [Planctomycetaceae bacterium]